MRSHFPRWFERVVAWGAFCFVLLVSGRSFFTLPQFGVWSKMAFVVAALAFARVVVVAMHPNSALARLIAPGSLRFSNIVVVRRKGTDQHFVGATLEYEGSCNSLTLNQGSVNLSAGSLDTSWEPGKPSVLVISSSEWQIDVRSKDEDKLRRLARAIWDMNRPN